MTGPGSDHADRDLEQLEDDIDAAKRDVSDEVREYDDEPKFSDTGSRSHGEDDQTIAPG